VFFCKRKIYFYLSIGCNKMGEQDLRTIAQVPNASSFALQYPVMQAGNNMLPQPMFYIPKALQFTTPPVIINETEIESLVENQSGACERKNWGGCRQSWGFKRNENCGWIDDGRQLGSFQNFVVSVIFGTISPVLSVILMFGMETSKLSRLGAIFGTANSLIMLPAIITAYMVHMNRHIENSRLVIPLIIGIIALVFALKSWREFLYIYRRRENKTDEERVKVISQIGCHGEFAASFFVSLLLPVFGALICVIIKRKSIMGRYGALSGFGLCFIIMGTVMAFKGIPPVLLITGILLMEFSLVHFRRALVCAELAQNTPATTA